MVMVPPPTNCLVLTSIRSGSMPVVSQSISRPMVPVGASTVAWLLRTPSAAARRQASSQARRAAASRPAGAEPASMAAVAARCFSSTPSMGPRLAWKPAKGPIRAARRAEAR